MINCKSIIFLLIVSYLLAKYIATPENNITNVKDIILIIDNYFINVSRELCKLDICVFIPIQQCKIIKELF